jgi:hypothetical protein
LLVRRYAHLSPSYLQEAVEKVSLFGKVKGTQITKAEKSHAEGKRDVVEHKEEAEALTAISTVPKIGKSGEGVEGQ